MELAPWPAVRPYHQRMARRPQVARAIGEQFELYKRARARHAPPRAVTA